MNLLAKLLEKRGVTAEQLDEQEKTTFESWRKILSEDELTVEKIKEFCRTQIDMIESKWKDLEKENSKKAELIPYHTCYQTIIAVIESPKAARESLENHLNQIINQ